MRASSVEMLEQHRRQVALAERGDVLRRISAFAGFSNCCGMK